MVQEDQDVRLLHVWRHAIEELDGFVSNPRQKEHSPTAVTNFILIESGEERGLQSTCSTIPGACLW